VFGSFFCKFVHQQFRQGFIALRKFMRKRLSDVCVRSNDLKTPQIFGENATNHFLDSGAAFDPDQTVAEARAR
jgi:hypothetical protein